MSHVIQQFAGVFPLPLEISSRTQDKDELACYHLAVARCEICFLLHSSCFVQINVILKVLNDLSLLFYGSLVTFIFGSVV